ncbi:MAG TPA: acyl-CoA dehydrogenase family protein [Alphaproteobacteria bacterium]|nr:acyl-CoA dehydrogenase family protein [Alphaproteobacteria bacterium]
MDFNDTPAEAEFRLKVAAWLDANAPKRVPGQTSGNILSMSAEDSSAVPGAKAWQKVKAAAGYAAITWPKEYGGLGGTSMQSVIYGQEEARYDVSSTMFVVGIAMAMPTLMVHGTPAQRERFIRPALFGEEVWCQLFSEPGAGSDLAGVRTRAEKQGDEWIVNGQKIWTSLAHIADWGILVARTDPTKPKHKGLSFFLVDMKTPGITVKPIKQISGGSSFNEVFFENVRVPDSMRVGAEGDGWKAALTVLMNERFAIGGIGGGAGGLSDLLALARNTEMGDGPAIRNAAVREKLADWYVQSQGLKYTRMRSLTAMSKGQTPGPESSIAKAVGASYGQDLPAFAMELMDLGGIIRDPAIAPGAAGFQDGWISAPAMRVAGGTDEIMRNIIAEQVLGLPGDTRIDKAVPFNELPSGR